jgi:regulator of nucleoside diphosphate kinase
MKKLPIIMNSTDHEELNLALAAAGKLNDRALAEVSALRRELDRAEIVAPDAVPSDVITMNSRAELLDLDTNERMEFTLVFPAEADVEEGKISILAPLGTAMLGYRVGNEFEWIVPYGRRRLKVVAVRFQPEAALHNEGEKPPDEAAPRRNGMGFQLSVANRGAALENHNSFAGS